MNQTKEILSGNEFYYKKIIYFFLLTIVFSVFLSLLVHSISLSSINYQKYLKDSNNLFFLCFFFGIIATATVQSSSAITTLAVAFVAKGDLSLQYAIPIVIGSNIGTTVTPLIFSYVHSDKRGPFKRALKIAFAHNLFNVYTAVIMVFVELKFGLLTYSCTWLGHLFFSSALEKSYFIPLFVKDFVEPISNYLAGIFKFRWLSAIIGFVGMYLTIKGFVKLFASNNINSNDSIVNKFLFNKGYKPLVVGLFGTAVIHSSSATISILQTIACSYKVPLKKTYNFILGANIGTTFTALLAGLFNAELALSLAIAHFLFNLIGVLIWGILPFMRNAIHDTAENMSKIFEKYRASLIIYISILFFLTPLLLIYIF